MIRVGIIGLGRAGKALTHIVGQQEDMQIVFVCGRSGSSIVGKPLNEVVPGSDKTVMVSDSSDLESLIRQEYPDVVADFSNPGSCLTHLNTCIRTGVNMVVGVTGFADTQLTQMKSLSPTWGNGIVMAPNITKGVNVLMYLSKLCAALLQEYDYHVTEKHHRLKKDAPSGTAVRLSEMIRGILPEGHMTGITSVRAGGIIGVHEVMAAGQNDQITLAHESYSRLAFADGAVRAVRYVYNKRGWFSMEDVFGFNDRMAELLRPALSGDKRGETVCI